jgi:hypothetical protein
LNSHHQFFGYQPVNQTHRTVVANLQSFRQFAHGDLIPSRKTLDGQQCLVLLWRNAGRLGCGFTEMNEFPQSITKRGKCLVFRFLEFINRTCHCPKITTNNSPSATICLTIS